ncbi:MAG: hypothetical protein ACK8QZ_05560 [Anaerolineales bacterium]
MYLVLVVLHNPSRLDEVLNAWEEEGIQRVTILFSTGMGRIRQAKWRDDLPLIPSLENFYHEERFSRTIFTIVPDREGVQKLHRATVKVIGDLSQQGTGILIAVPVAEAFGLNKLEK